MIAVITLEGSTPFGSTEEAILLLENKAKKITLHVLAIVHFLLKEA